MHNRPDRGGPIIGGTGRSGRRSATDASIGWALAVGHSARTLRIAGQATGSTTIATAILQ
ncbi:hypothetical protein [Kitasatospora sp. NPDC056531]|uniref:hypothetical protein n=1 Tax=Kitasatospora sp. NPDC056531 TaxID=3345856 RepID=UPI0036B4B7FE